MALAHRHPAEQTQRKAATCRKDKKERHHIIQDHSCLQCGCTQLGVQQVFLSFSYLCT